MKNIFVLLISLLIINNLIAQEDHTEYIEGPFATPQEVTATCLECHDGIEEGIMKSRHWRWMGADSVDSHQNLGKQNIINNFCIAVESNWPRCTSCHIGYGFKDKSFDFENPNNIDCLVCHDQSGQYKKTPTGAGMPDEKVDLVLAAQSVGPTKRANCGTCHFNGGGGTAVKHGDLDESLLNPTPEIDVHMGRAGFQCSECHAGEDHAIIGASHGSMESNTNHFYCADCHTEKPHVKKILNNHTKTVACETCHIPEFARGMATKVWWDWSKAGEDKKGEKDEFGMSTYHKKKGEFVWDMNVIPTYSWYNGKADYYKIGDKIDPTKVVKLNSLNGDINDPNSKIAPFKVMRGKQLYDAGNNYLAVPKLFGKGGYWKTFDWNAAAKLGMESVGLEYSGEVGFIETEMYWPLNHTVTVSENALSCTSCHGAKGKKRLNWEELGYKGDPMKNGGRFK